MATNSLSGDTVSARMTEIRAAAAPQVKNSSSGRMVIPKRWVRSSATARRVPSKPPAME